MFFVIFLLASVRVGSAVFSWPKPARVAEHMELPWHAVLLKRATESTYGGVIASRFYVLTVCKRYSVFRKLDAGEITYSNVRVLGGTRSIKPYEYQGAQVRWIYYWEDHPKCRNGGDSGYRTYDISVVKVTQMFIFNAFLKPMPFERDQAKMKKTVDEWISSNKKTCTFAGFGGYRFKNITVYPTIEYYKDNPRVEYDPGVTSDDYECCISKELRVIEMRLTSYSECFEPATWVYNYRKVYIWDPPIDTFCAIGAGSPGNATFMRRTGMVCDLDFGGPIECRRDDGDKKGEYLVIGHASYSSVCNIKYADLPQMFTRYDWVLHKWIMQFWNEDPFGDHWVDAEYRIALEYCNDTLYSGPIPPDLTSNIEL